MSDEAISNNRFEFHRLQPVGEWLFARRASSEARKSGGATDFSPWGSTSEFFKDLELSINDFNVQLRDLNELYDRPSSEGLARRNDAAMNGGIDLNTAGMSWKIGKDGRGVEMTVDSAMIERIRHIGIDSLSPVIFRITPVTDIWSLVGLQAPLQQEH